MYLHVYVGAALHNIVAIIVEARRGLSHSLTFTTASSRNLAAHSVGPVFM